LIARLANLLVGFPLPTFPRRARLWFAPNNPEQSLFVDVGPEHGEIVLDVIPALSFVPGMEGQTVVRERHQLVVIGIAVGKDVVRLYFIRKGAYANAGGGFPIHPDLYAQTDFRLCC
jgi:hypothetical protein